MRTWRLLPQTTPLPPELLAAAGGRRWLARILAQRGVTEPAAVRAFLNPEAYVPSPPEEMPGLEAGVRRIQEAIRAGERILVWGDFDVDGQTSTALFVSALQQLGAAVDYHIPIRAVESHGVRPDVLQTYLEHIDLLLTCDTGIAAADAVALAREAGVDTVVTDHHDLPDRLPEAVALVNPKFLPPEHPLATLPGVGVVYKVVEALFRNAGRDEGGLEAFLDLVALGIVSDVATLTGDTRYLLQRGLRVLRHTRRVGLLALMERAGIQQARMNEEDIGFGIGPRLNAVGRLDNANVSVPLLTTSDPVEASRIADRLEELNEERRLLTEQVYGAASEQLARDPTLVQFAAIVLAHPRWHQGVIGIVASRLVEEYGKPVILLASPEGTPARGSARSVDGFNITRAIATQAAILHGFGGHPMAAGLAIDAEQIDRFRVGVSTALTHQRDGAAPDPVLEIGLKVGLGDLTQDLVAEIEAAGPFGPGNPPVNLLSTGLLPAQTRVIGKTRNHRKVVLRDEALRETEALWWNSAEEPALESDRTIDLVFRARSGAFRGQPTLTLTWQDHREAGGEARRKQEEGRKVVDWRHRANWAEIRTEVLNRHDEAIFWGEGPGEEVLRHMMGRHEGGAAEVLVVWTAPPDQRVMDRLLHRVDPAVVYVVGMDPGMDTPKAFVQRLAGVVKHVLAALGGKVALERLAGAMASTEPAVREGLRILGGLWGMEIELAPDGMAVFRKPAPLPPDAPQPGMDLLAELLRESNAYRQYFRKTTTLDALVDRLG